MVDPTEANDTLPERKMPLNLGDGIRRRGMEWRHLSIRDVSIPDGRFERAWPRQSREIRERLRAGDNVLVHCRGGLGRAGMIAARLLVDEGVDPDAAIAAIRAARPGAIETPAQEDGVRGGASGGTHEFGVRVRAVRASARRTDHEQQERRKRGK